MGIDRKAKAKLTGSLRHGHAKEGEQSPEYRAWLEMRRRCYEPTRDSYPRYGGRGIRVCAEWLHSFESFLRCVGERPGPDFSIGRIDNDGDYTPINVRWETAHLQARNKINSRLVEIDGVSKNLVDWAYIAGVRKSTMHWRLENWPPERWLEPPGNNNRKGK